MIVLLAIGATLLMAGWLARKIDSIGNEALRRAYAEVERLKELAHQEKAKTPHAIMRSVTFRRIL